MGGKKKLTLKQMERMQAREDQKKGTKSRRSTGSGAENETSKIFISDPKSKKIIGELTKMNVLTPYSVASRLNLSLSVAKNFLHDLERKGTIEYVSGSRRLKIYKIADLKS